MNKITEVKLPRKAVVFILVAALTALTFWLSPESRFYIFVGVAIVAFATILLGVELFQKNKMQWGHILAPIFIIIIVAFIVWGWSRADLLQKQQEASPAIAETPCEVLLTIVGIQWQQGQAPTYRCDSVASVEALIRSQTEKFGETDWAERQIIALLGPNRDQWNTSALLIERHAYNQALSGHQNDRFYVDFNSWLGLFILAAFIPFAISFIGFFQPPKYEVWGIIVPIALPLAMFQVVKLYENQYTPAFILGIGIELVGFIIPMIARMIYPRLGHPLMFYLFQAIISTPLMLVFAFPHLANIVSEGLNLTLALALDTYLLGYFAGKGAIGLYYFVNAWFWGGR